MPFMFLICVEKNLCGENLGGEKMTNMRSGHPLDCYDYQSTCSANNSNDDDDDNGSGGGDCHELRTTLKIYCI